MNLTPIHFRYFLIRILNAFGLSCELVFLFLYYCSTQPRLLVLIRPIKTIKTFSDPYERAIVSPINNLSNNIYVNI